MKPGARSRRASQATTLLGLLARVVFIGGGGSPQRPFTRGERARLVLEIVVSYAQLLRLLRRDDLPTMVGRARQTRTALAPPADDAAALATVARLGRVTDRVIAVLPRDGRCLITSLVVIRVLARRAVDATVVIGVRNEGGFAAHAWVEYEGHPLYPPGDYHRLVEI